EHDRRRLDELQYVGQLAGHVVGVERDVDGPEPVHRMVGEVGLDGAVVVEQDADPVTGPDARRGERRRDLACPVAERGVAWLHLVAGEQARRDQRRRVAAGVRAGVEQFADGDLRPGTVRPPELAHSGYPTATPSSTRSMYSMIP